MGRETERLLEARTDHEPVPTTPCDTNRGNQIARDASRGRLAYFIFSSFVGQSNHTFWFLYQAASKQPSTSGMGAGAVLFSSVKGKLHTNELVAAGRNTNPDDITYDCWDYGEHSLSFPLTTVHGFPKPTGAHVRTSAHKRAGTRAHTHTRTRARARVHTHTHTRTHTRTHTNTSTQAHKHAHTDRIHR